MILKAFGERIDRDTLAEIWPEFVNDVRLLNNYAGTNIRTANAVLNIILSQNEKKCLESAFFGENGWYRKINDDGMTRLKLAAMSLGLTNHVFTFNAEKEKEIIKIIQQISKDEQILMMRCYAKQKIVTFLTLKNYLNKIKKTEKMSIKLYRGINKKYNNQKYLFSGLESWTSSIENAYQFAREEGFVIEKEYPISQVFAGVRSTFKNKENGMYKNNGFFVRREHEMIVENIESEYDCSNMKHIFFAVDNEIV